MENTRTKLVGYFGGGAYNKDTKKFEISKNISKAGNLSLGLQYNISSKDMDGNKIYNGIKVKLMLSDKSEYDKVVKLIEDKCELEGFFSAVQFKGSEDKVVKYIEYIAKFEDLKKAGTTPTNKETEPVKEDEIPW